MLFAEGIISVAEEAGTISGGLPFGSLWEDILASEGTAATLGTGSTVPFGVAFDALSSCTLFGIGTFSKERAFEETFRLERGIDASGDLFSIYREELTSDCSLSPTPLT